jgi:hypothetical protein
MYNPGHKRGDEPMKWLTAILALLLLGLAAFPAIESASAWLAHRSDSVESINYISREIHELSASRRRAAHPRRLDDAPAD